MELELKNCSFGYNKGELLLKDINFTLTQGQVLCILGQNGIGKTTLLKCLTGIFKWNEGGTYVNGIRQEATRFIKGISYVPQAHGLSFPYTIEELVIMGRARYIGTFSTPKKEDKEIVYKYLKGLGIYDLKDKKCNELSGGQLQLAYIARALVSEPEILILDEPESHLDYKNQILIMQVIEDLVHSNNISCIINTHYPEHALKLADNILLLNSDGYECGMAKDIMTEENIKKYFDINAKIINTPFNGKDILTIVPLY